MGYLVLPLFLIIVGGYIMFLSKEKKKETEDVKNDIKILDHITSQLSSVASESALDRLLAIVVGIDNKHINDEMYIINVDRTKGAIEARRKQIIKDFGESDLNDTTDN